MQDAQITEDMQLRRTVDDEERLAILAQYGIDDDHWEPTTHASRASFVSSAT